MNSDKPKKGLSPRCKRNLIFTFLIIIFIISILGYKYLLYPSYIEKHKRAFFVEYMLLEESYGITPHELNMLAYKHHIPQDKIIHLIVEGLQKGWYTLYYEYYIKRH